MVNESIRFRGESFTIAGSSGEIEAMINFPEQDLGMPVVIICHPHSLYGGTMQNKVVHTLANSFNELGSVCVRFNFRGVGSSAGEYSGGIGETDDLNRVIDTMRERFPTQSIWLAGFSFGAYVALRAHTHEAVERLLLVAPPVSMFNCDEFAPVHKPWTVIHGTDDDLIPSAAVSRFVERMEHPPEVHFLNEASHYFHGRLNDLRRLVKRLYLRFAQSPSAGLPRYA